MKIGWFTSKNEMKYKEKNLKIVFRPQIIENKIEKTFEQHNPIKTT